jgi:ABC-type nitrate/sulfonate/bicarbonate transport system permease component
LTARSFSPDLAYRESWSSTLVFRLGELSKVVMVAISAFYPVLINTVLGVVNLDEVYLDVGDNYRLMARRCYGPSRCPERCPASWPASNSRWGWASF